VGSIIVVKEDGEQWKIEIEKFNGESFEFWNLKMDHLLVDREQWIDVDPISA